MPLPLVSRTLALLGFFLVTGSNGFLIAAPPAITSPATVDIFYDAQNPGDVQFAYRIAASNGPVTFEATGLPPDAAINPSTGWINGSRNAPGSYDVSVRATNADGAATATLRLAIHPAAMGVTSSQGVFRPGENFDIVVHYNTNVVVTGAPHLSLAIGPSGAVAYKDAVYASGSGTNTLVFRYTVQSGDEDADGVQLSPSAPSGGTVCDMSGLTASPTLPVRYFVSGITIAASGAASPVSGGSAQPAGAAASASGRLVNVSARMRIVEGDASRSLIAGFVVTGKAEKRVLLRAIGPGLTAFGVAGALLDPRLQLYTSTGALVAANDNWSGVETSSTAGAVGAFALSQSTRDAAVVVSLAPGAYTLVVSPQGGTGVALAEIYDADGGATTDGPEIVNLSTRGYIEAGDGGALIAGFAVKGEGARKVLVRGIGPALNAFGVSGALADPTLKIYQGDRLVATNDDWAADTGGEVSAAGSATGAFALAVGSKDAALVVNLPPGAYTAVVSAKGNASGAGLVEVYELPASGQ